MDWIMSTILVLVLIFLPPLALGGVAAFAMLDASLINPINWDEFPRGIAGIWALFILGCFFAGILDSTRND